MKFKRMYLSKLASLLNYNITTAEGVFKYICLIQTLYIFFQDVVWLRKNIFKTIGVALLAVLLISYISVQIVNALTAYKTEMAVMHSAYDSIDCDGFIIRNESILSGSSDGVLRYVLKDGERVSKNGVVAETYSTEEAVYAKEE